MANQGRLAVEFRTRAKAFAATVVRLFVKLLGQQEEASVICKQQLRSGISVAAHAWPVK